MLAFLAEHAQTAALSELFPRVIHSTTSTLMFVYPAVLAKLPALQAQSLKADRQDQLADYLGCLTKREAALFIAV